MKHVMYSSVPSIEHLAFSIPPWREAKNNHRQLHLLDLIQIISNTPILGLEIIAGHMSSLSQIPLQQNTRAAYGFSSHPQQFSTFSSFPDWLQPRCSPSIQLGVITL